MKRLILLSAFFLLGAFLTAGYDSSVTKEMPTNQATIQNNDAITQVHSAKITVFAEPIEVYAEVTPELVKAKTGIILFVERFTNKHLAVIRPPPEQASKIISNRNITGSV